METMTLFQFVRRGWWATLVLCTVGCASSATTSHNDCVRGVTAFHQGNYAQASVDFRKALSENPKNADALYNMGAVYHQLWVAERNPGDAAQAEQYYRDALALDPDMTEAYRGVAVLMTTQGRQQEAMQTLYAWARRDQTSAAPRLELARICEEQNSPDAAAQYLAEAEKIEPQNPRVLAAIGRLREKAGETNAAAMYYVRATQNSDAPELKAHIASLRNPNINNGITPYTDLSQGTYVASNSGPSSGISSSTNVTEGTQSFGNGRFLERLSQLFSSSQEPQYRSPAMTTLPYGDSTGTYDGYSGYSGYSGYDGYDETMASPNYGTYSGLEYPSGNYGNGMTYSDGPALAPGPESVNAPAATAIR